MPEPGRLADDRAAVELLSSEPVFEGVVWDVRRERFRLDGAEIAREFVAHTGAVAVLAMDEHDRVLLIKQYRHPIRTRDWELPAGLLDIAGEPPLTAAQREFAEETDLVAEHWAVLSDFWTSPGGSDESGQGVPRPRGERGARTHARTEEEAGIELRWVESRRGGGCRARAPHPQCDNRDRAARGAGESGAAVVDARAGGCAVVAASGRRPGALSRPMELAVAVDRYLRHVAIERGLSANTLQAYRRDLDAYLGWLARRAVTATEAVTAAEVSGFAAELRTREVPLAASSVARMLSSVRGLHRFLAEEGIVAVDVAADAKPPKLAMRLPKAISIEQMAAVLAATDGDDIVALRDKALLELLYATGARISEAVALDVDDMIEPDVVRLFGKGGKQRIVPVGSFARTAIDAYLVRARPVLSQRGTATPALFLGARGRRLSRQNAWLIIRAAAERAKLGIDISPHTFRHSFATHLLAGGADVRVVQELLGHSSVATTQLYTLVTADTLRDVYQVSHPRAR